MRERNCLLTNHEICSNDIMSLHSLRSKQNKSKHFPVANSLVEIILLYDDRFYQQRLSLHSTFICSTHLKELLKEYSVSSYRRCWLCVCMKKSLPNKSERNITPVQALTIHEHFHIRHSYGKTVCSTCRQLLSANINTFNISRHENAFKWIINIENSDVDSDDSGADDDYKAPFLYSSPNNDNHAPPNVDKRKRSLLNEFLSLCGSRKVIRTTDSYNVLQKQSKANFLLSARHLFRYIIDFIASGNSSDFVQELFPTNDETNKYVYDRQLVPVMNGIAEAYQNAEDQSTRRSILSIVAPKIKFSLLQSFIPGITYYRFITARFHASETHSGALLKKPSRIVYRFEPAQVDHFVDFIVSNYVCTDMPYGERTIALSDGTKLLVPDTIRNCNSTRIISQYYKYSAELFPDFPLLHDSTLFKILNECKASTRKALNGLNYFAANGGEAFDDLLDLISNLNLDFCQQRRLADNLKRGKQYLKTDYKINVARTSPVRDHCICFAATDPTSNYFSATCTDHDHDQVCAECTYLAQTFQDIRQAIKDAVNDREEIQRKLYKFNLAYDAVQAWKCHQLRSVNQDLGRDCVLDILGDDAVYLNLDFAMKWLPAQYREPQTGFFGKRGVTWHITVVSRKKSKDWNNIDMINGSKEQDVTITSDDEQDFSEKEDEDTSDAGATNLNDFDHTVFVHVIDQCAQDSNLVVAIIDDVLSRLKAYDSSIQQACLRSDNAACYHSAYTILSIPAISEKSGIAIRRLDFADPQGGKGSSDRFAAVIKSHVRRYLNEKHDVTNAEQFVEACLSYGGVRNVNVVECTFKPTRQSVKFQFNNIKKFRNFCYERHGIRVFRAWNIGEGQLFPYHKLIHGIVNISSIELINPSRNITFGSSIQNNLPSIRSVNQAGRVDKSTVTTNDNNLFECPEEGCIRSYMKYGNLVRHLAIGDHKKKLEKNTLIDTAKKLYHSKLLAAENKRVISLSVDNITFNSSNYNQVPTPNVGWGLPAINPPTRFTIQQKQFLQEKFDDGFLRGRFWKPETVAKEMQQVKTYHGKYVFETNEWLTTSQIRSYFSRMKQTSLKEIDQQSSFNSSKSIVFDFNEDQEEQEPDEEAHAEEFFKDDTGIQEAIERNSFISDANCLASKSGCVLRNSRSH